MMRTFATLFLATVSLFHITLTQTTSQQTTVERSVALQSCVRDFLAGKGRHEVLAFASGGTFQEKAPRAEVIKDSYKNSEIVFLKALNLNDGAAVMLVKTKSAKRADEIHTFVLQLGKVGGWEIKAWHRSHG